MAVLLLGVLAVFSCTPAGISFWKQACKAAGFGDWSGGQLLEIHVMDVGKADAILIKSKGEAALLDAGKCSAAVSLADYLSRFGVEKLDYLIMSHSDKDHMGGMPQLLRELPVGGFVEAASGLPGGSQEWEDLEYLLESREVMRLALEPGDCVTVGEAVLTALGPVQAYEEPNNASLVLKLTCGPFSALFCGDMEQEAEQDLLDSGQDLGAVLLKVGHHGSKTSSSTEFLQAVRPAYAVISTGPDRNRLPREEVLIRLEETGAKLYRTDTDGTVVFQYDGKSMTIDTEK